MWEAGDEPTTGSSTKPLWRDEFSVHAPRSATSPPAVRQVPGADQPRHVRGNVWIWLRSLWRRGRAVAPGGRRRAASARCRSAASSCSTIPAPHDPCILVRSRDGRASSPTARSARTCPAPSTTRAERDRLECPCHEGYFSVDDGRVLQGPPPRPLPRIVLEQRGGRHRRRRRRSRRRRAMKPMPNPARQRRRVAIDAAHGLRGHAADGADVAADRDARERTWPGIATRRCRGCCSRRFCSPLLRHLPLRLRHRRRRSRPPPLKVAAIPAILF